VNFAKRLATVNRGNANSQMVSNS